MAFIESPLSRTHIQDISPDSDGDILAEWVGENDTLDNSGSGLRSVPYSRIYDDLRFSDVMPNVFIRDRQVRLTIDDIESLPNALSLFHQYLYTITLHHGDSKWTIKRKSRQISSLHNQLKLFKAKLKIPAATSGARERRQSMKTQIKLHSNLEEAALQAQREHKRLIKFPRKSLQRLDTNAKEEVQAYLGNLMLHSLLRSHQDVLEFFEISPLSFVSALGTKLKEGYVDKRTPSKIRSCGSSCLATYKTRWMVLGETCIFFIVPNEGAIRTVMLMDSGFQVSHGFRHTRVSKGLLVTNLSRSLLLKCDGEEADKNWATAIQGVCNNLAADFVKENRFLSFAPVRENSFARWYVDGYSYMHDVADMLNSAKEEIFITDWWLSPDIYLKRPDLTGKESRLSEILKRQADKGVKIFILLYKEVELALGLKSLYSKQSLSRISSNIKILRHPDHYNPSSLYWAHHEKIVVIDQMHAFVGGIDLCYGRWDDCRHKLTDLGHGGVMSKARKTSKPLALLIQGSHEMFTLNLSTDDAMAAHSSAMTSHHSKEDAIDAKFKYLSMEPQNGAQKSRSESDPVPSSRLITTSDQSNLKKTASDEKLKILSKESSAKIDGRTSWQMKAVKTFGIDLMDEVREKRREAKSARTGKKLVKFKRYKNSDSEESLSPNDSEGEYDQRKRRKKLQKKWMRGLKAKKTDKPKVSMGSLADLHRDFGHEEATSVHLWVGKDYVNWIAKDLTDPHDPFKDNVNRHETPRMPWHDIALFVEGPAARDAARHFIQRWNAIKHEKVANNPRYCYLVPKAYHPSSFSPSPLQPKHKVKCQVVRSVGPWSAGVWEKERSIYNAYIDAIKSAKHYIYIENQFFITCSSQQKKEVLNNIGYHLAERILKAHRNGETFRVYIIVPLLPAFEGQVGTTGGVAMQYILHYTYQSILRGPNSLIGRLNEEQVCWQNYLCFCSLRTNELLENDLITELIYVHSKLIIVDDRLVIAGSANINDRSLLGERDSEVALVIEDEEFELVKMNGKDFNRGLFAGSLRMFLFSEHLGVSDKCNKTLDVSDPLSDEFFLNTWQAIASSNTEIYENVFNCIPTNSANTFAELTKIREKVPLSQTYPEGAKTRLKNIQGNLVLYPLMFLKDELIKPGPTNKEFLLPYEMWT